MYFRLEKEFQAWYGRMLKSKGHLYHKISDMSRWLKPCDMFDVAPSGVTSFRELKKIDWYTININHFEPQQIEFMIRAWERWTSTFIVVYSVKLNQYVELNWYTIAKLLVSEKRLKISSGWKNIYKV